MNHTPLAGFVAPAPLFPGTWVGRSVSSRRPAATHCVAAPAGRGPSSTNSSMPDFPESRRPPQRNGGDGVGGPRAPYSERRTGGGGGGPPRGRFGGDREPRAPRRPIPPGVPTYTECGKCSAVYEITAADLGEGRKVQCAVCDNTWFQRPESLRGLREGLAFKDYPLDRKNEFMASRAERAANRGRDRGPPGRDGGRFGDGGGTDRRRAPNGGPRGREQEGGPPQERRFDGQRGAPREFDRRGEGQRAPGGYRPRAGNGQHSVFIGNIPFTITSGELETLLQSAGGVERVSLVTDPNGRSKGFAFADMKSADDVSHCVDTLNGYEMDGRQLTVRVGRKK